MKYEFLTRVANVEAACDRFERYLEFYADGNICSDSRANTLAAVVNTLSNLDSNPACDVVLQVEGEIHHPDDKVNQVELHVKACLVDRTNEILERLKA